MSKEELSLSLGLTDRACAKDTISAINIDDLSQFQLSASVFRFLRFYLPIIKLWLLLLPQVDRPELLVLGNGRQYIWTLSW